MFPAVTTTNLLQGVSQVSLIQPNGSPSSTYIYPSGSGLFLYAVFDGFNAVSFPAGPGVISFTGGTLKYYVSTNGSLFDNTMSFSANLANISNAANSKLWLSLVFLQLSPVPGDPAPTPWLSPSRAAGSPTLGNFVSAASTNAYLNVVGGDAASAFDTGLIADADAPGGFVDAYYTGVASQTLCLAGPVNCVPFPITGSNDLYANPIPEPVSISLFGGGLAAMGAFVRRRKAKKA